MSDSKKNSVTQTFRFYWQQAMHYPRKVVGAAFAIPFAVFVNNYAPPLILATILNRLNQHEYMAHNPWASLGWLLVAYGVLAILGGYAWRIVDFFNWGLEAEVQRDIARKVFKHLTEQSADFHANSFVGSLVSQTSKLLGAYIRIADQTMFQVLPMLWGIVFAAAIMLPRAPLYSLVLVVTSIFFIISAFFVTKPSRKYGAIQAAAESAQTGALADALTNAMAIKSFAREKQEQARFARATDETRSGLLGLMHVTQRQLTFFGVTTGTLELLALLVVVYSVTMLHANIATAFLIFSYTSGIAQQLFNFSNNSLRTYNRAIGDATDMIEILAVASNIQDPLKPQATHFENGAIEFRDVTFTHSGNDEALFERLNLTIAPGEKIGLVGHSGSGKTTFTRLLLRFSDLDGGEILIDGQDIAKVTQADVHRAVTYVPQEPLLFHRSILENINYGNPEASQKAIEKVARQAHALEFIETLPQGYETLVGERGVKLSGGQRQRIAIARAMLKDAPILLLDEATSALDSESEVLIQDALWKLMEHKTAIVIAHRLSTIQKMDRIIVLDEGAIVEQGSHQELLEAGGSYAKLWAHQSGGFIDD